MRSAYLCLILLLGCGSGTDVEPATAAAEVSPEDPGGGDDGVAGDAAAVAVVVGDWTSYGEPEDEAEWPTETLTSARWAQVSAELACAGRANHGDPEALTAASRRILAHHRTTGPAVMNFGIAVNDDPTRAHALGEAVAAATEACR